MTKIKKSIDSLEKEFVLSSYFSELYSGHLENNEETIANSQIKMDLTLQNINKKVDYCFSK